MRPWATRRATRGTIACVIVRLTAVVACLVATSCTDDNPSVLPGSEQATDATASTPADGEAGTEQDPCPDPIHGVNEAVAALDGAMPGSIVCITGDEFAGVELSLTRSGEQGDPVRLIGRDATVRSVTIDADDVSVEGLSVVGGEGIEAAGTRLSISSNTVEDARLDGIRCDPCAGAKILGNTIDRADGTGIWVSGQQIVVHGNTIRGSVRIESNDADGIRFFGSGHRITANTITDIKDDGYTGEPPHTDCFQTYDNGGKLPTTDTFIGDNVCDNVDHQCLIATAEEAGSLGDVGRSTRLQFVGNTCNVGGSQAVLVRWFTNVEVRENRLAGAELERGVYLADHSAGASVAGNEMDPGVPELEADDTSMDGLRTD